MEYFFHIRVVAAQCPLFGLERVQNCLPGFVEDDLFSTLQPFLHRDNVARLMATLRWNTGSRTVVK